MSVTCKRLYLKRRSLIAAASGLTLWGALGNRARADDDGLDDASADWQALNPPLPVPELKFSTVKGKPGRLDEYLGHVVVVNLWATWCGPCKMELPSLNRLAARIKPFGGVVLAISVDDDGLASAGPFIKARGFKNLVIGTDPDGDDLDAVGADGIPATVVLRPDGKVVAALEGGANWDTDKVVAFLQKLAGSVTAPDKSDVVKV